MIKLIIGFISIIGVAIFSAYLAAKREEMKGTREALCWIALIISLTTSSSLMTSACIDVREFEKNGAKIETMNVNYEKGDTTYTYIPRRG